MNFDFITSQVLNRRKSSKLKPWQKAKEKVFYHVFGRGKLIYDTVMQGKFIDLPSTNNRTVRVFISSTFSDLNLERNTLMKQVYPKLKLYCREKYGFEFHAIDMRWGVPNVSQLDHLGPQICYNETILGQRYGEYEIPFSINVEEMQLIREWSKKIPHLTLKCFEAFDEWYLLDKNSLNLEYQLKPIAEIFEMLDSKYVENSKQRWNECREEMRNGFNVIIPVLVDNGLMDQNKAKKYAISVTEHEIELGILNTTETNRRRIGAFLRNITDLERVKQYSKSNKFLDMEQPKLGILDDVRYEQIVDLKNITLAAVLRENNIRSYNVSWDVFEKEGVERSMYLQKFCLDFESKIIALIDKTMSEMSSFENDDLYVEVLQHLHNCNEFVKEFHGRQDVLKAVENYVTGPSTNPFIIYGQSGSGKTSVMAKLVVEARNWLPESEMKPKHVTMHRSKLRRSRIEKQTSQISTEASHYQSRNKTTNIRPKDKAALIVRFLGTSPGTSTLRQTLKFICRQLAVLINNCDGAEFKESVTQIDIEYVRSLDKFQTILNTFYDLLNQLSLLQRWVVIFLDAIDQLDPSDGAYFLEWIRAPLPKRVKLIMSTLPDVGNILINYRAHFDNLVLANQDQIRKTKHAEPTSFEIDVLDNSMCEKLLRNRLLARGRCLQLFQWRLVRRALLHCRLTIYIVLVERVVSQWRSWHQPDFVLANEEEQFDCDPVCTDKEAALAIQQWPNLELSLNVREAIIEYFVSLEFTHGKLLTSHAISYITASCSGLSESELVDILSLDDEVLQDVFEHHLPPQIRAPPFVWARLRSALGSNLAEREADGIIVIFWYHRQFIEASQDYYLSDKNFRRKIHSNIADYFLGKWAGVKKPFQYPKYLARKLNLPPFTEEDRMVPDQPYVYEENSSDKSKLRLNLRKLNELPWHLVHSERLEEFYSHIMFNFEYLFNKLRGTSRSQLLQDLQLPLNFYQAFVNLQETEKRNAQNNLSKTQSSRSKHGGLKSGFYMSNTMTNDNPFCTQPPTVEVIKIYNFIRIAALSLDVDPTSLAIDLLGRLGEMFKSSYSSSLANYLRHSSRHQRASLFNIHSKSKSTSKKRKRTTVEVDNNYSSNSQMKVRLEKLLKQARQLGRRYCGFLPRTTCFDSGSGLLHTAFDIGMGIGRLMSNNLLLSIALDGGSVSWFDLNGNLVKHMKLPEVNLTCMKLLLSNQGLPNPIGLSVLMSKQLTEDDDKAGDPVRLINIVQIDYFAGRVSTLETLDKVWSDIFSMSTLNLLTPQWIGSTDGSGQCLYLGYRPTKQLVVQGLVCLAKSFYYSNLNQFVSFTSVDTEANYIVDLTIKQVTIALLTDEQIYHGFKLESDDMVYFVQNSQNNYELCLCQPTDVVDHDNFTHLKNVNFDSFSFRSVQIKLRIGLNIGLTNLLSCTLYESANQLADKLVVYLLKAKRKKAQDFGFVWDHRNQTEIMLRLPFEVNTDDLDKDEINMTKEVIRYTNIFGDGATAAFSYDNELLFTTGHSCFLLVWSCITGHLLKVISQGDAESIFSGLSIPNTISTSSLDNESDAFLTNSASTSGSYVTISHFPDQSSLQYSESSDQALFIMCKIFNVEALRKPDKRLAKFGSQLYDASDIADNSADVTVETNLMTDMDQTDQEYPLIFKPSHMTIDYVYDDALPTLVLVTYRKGDENFEDDSLVLYDLDEDAQNYLHCWSDVEINAKSLNAFLHTQHLDQWPVNENYSSIAYIHTTMTKLKILTIFNLTQMTFTYTYLDPKQISYYLPNLYVPTAHGSIEKFGLLDVQYGLLTLVRYVHATKPRLVIQMLKTCPDDRGMIDVWDDRSHFVIRLTETLDLVRTAANLILDDKRGMQSMALNLLTYRPNYPFQIVLGMTESHKSMYPVTRDDGRPIVWLGFVVIIDLGLINQNGLICGLASPQILSVALLDFGPQLLLMSDGLTAINYRLAKYNIETGNRMDDLEGSAIDKVLRMVSKNFAIECQLKPPVSIHEMDDVDGTTDAATKTKIANVDDSIFLQSLSLVNDERLLVGKKHQPEVRLHLDLVDNDSDDEASVDSEYESDEDYGAPPARCLMAYNCSNMVQLTQYMFENEPYLLWISRDENTLIAITPNEYMRGFDLGYTEDNDRLNEGLYKKLNLAIMNKEGNLQTHMIEEVLENDNRNSNEDASESEITIKMIDYFKNTGLLEMLQKAMLDVANYRPFDPITFVATSLQDQVKNRKQRISY